MQLNEQYRPKTFKEVIAQPKAVSLLQRFESKGNLAGRAYWIAGKSGTGKTTLARIIADKVASGMYIEEMDAQTVLPSTIAQWTHGQLYAPMGAIGRCYIINESHGLRKDTIRALLIFLEALKDDTTVVFTTTIDGQADLFEVSIDADPLLSRCVQITLASQGIAKPFAQRALEIARTEDLDGQPLEAYIKLVNKHKGNFRAVLSAIESGVMIAN